MPFCLSVSLFLCFSVSLFHYFSVSLFLCLSLLLYFSVSLFISVSLPDRDRCIVDWAPKKPNPMSRYRPVSGKPPGHTGSGTLPTTRGPSSGSFRRPTTIRTLRWSRSRSGKSSSLGFGGRSRSRRCSSSGRSGPECFGCSDLWKMGIS
jgi:hypothetical protein